VENGGWKFLIMKPVDMIGSVLFLVAMETINLPKREKSQSAGLMLRSNCIDEIEYGTSLLSKMKLCSANSMWPLKEIKST
jgi:hypothetical protein